MSGFFCSACGTIVMDQPELGENDAMVCVRGGRSHRVIVARRTVDPPLNCGETTPEPREP